MRMMRMKFFLKKTLDYGSWVVFSIILIYSFLFYITRNAVPGEFLYPTKLGVEKILVASSKVLYNSVEFEMDFVARRFNEVSKVLSSKYGSESLHRLDTQVTETATSIANIKDPKARKEAASKYAIQLSYISSGLEQEEKKIVKTTPVYRPPPSQPTSQNTAPNPTAPPSPPPPAIVQDIDNTQETIQETIEEMNEIQTQAPTIEPTNTPVPTNTPAPTHTPTPVLNDTNFSAPAGPEKNVGQPKNADAAPTATTAPAPTDTPLPPAPTSTPVIEQPTSTPAPEAPTSAPSP